MINHSRLANYFGDDYNLDVLLVDILDSIDKDFLELEQAVLEMNMEHIADIAHRIKSVIMLMGANNMVELANELESNARHGEYSHIDEIYANLYEFYNSINLEVKAINKAGSN